MHSLFTQIGCVNEQGFAVQQAVLNKSKKSLSLLVTVTSSVTYENTFYSPLYIACIANPFIFSNILDSHKFTPGEVRNREGFRTLWLVPPARTERGMNMKKVAPKSLWTALKTWRGSHLFTIS